MVGSIDAIIYLDFIQKIALKVRNQLADKDQRIYITMDNAQIHKSIIMKSFYALEIVYVIFTPSYSPQIHMVEYVFQRIKSKLRKQWLKKRRNLKETQKFQQ